MSDQSGSMTFSIGTLHVSSIRFTANVIGNIGAPLTDGDPVNPELEDADEDQELPPPVICDDPFTVGLITEEPGVVGTM